jgi:enoyl-CoA hydratase
MADNLKNLIVRLRDGVLTITINRPQALNILDLATRKELLGVLRSCEFKEKVRCVVITARGELFSAGADLKYLLSLDRKSASRYASFVRRFLSYVENYPKPTVGAVNGTAMGGGLELLLTLDIVISSSEARFGQTELNVGLIPGGGGSQRLPRLIGVRRAKKMIYTGELISAQEAFELGLISTVVEKEKVMEEALKVCETMKARSPLALKLAKRAITLALSKTIEDGLELETRLYKTILTSEDGREGMKAFLEKRKPTYLGR